MNPLEFAGEVILVSACCRQLPIISYHNQCERSSNSVSEHLNHLTKSTLYRRWQGYNSKSNICQLNKPWKDSNILRPWNY